MDKKLNDNLLHPHSAMPTLPEAPRTPITPWNTQKHGLCCLGSLCLDFVSPSGPWPQLVSLRMGPSSSPVSLLWCKIPQKLPLSTDSRHRQSGDLYSEHMGGPAAQEVPPQLFLPWPWDWGSCQPLSLGSGDSGLPLWREVHSVGLHNGPHMLKGLPTAPGPATVPYGWWSSSCSEWISEAETIAEYIYNSVIIYQCKY